MPKQHQSKATTKVLHQLESKGFTVSKKTKSGTIRICPPANIGGSIYHTHGTESALHYLKRDFKKMYNVDL